MFSKKFVRGVIVENKHWTERLYSLTVDAQIKVFLPGQFGRLGLVIDGEEVARPYSFVNAPSEAFLEFYSIIVADGLLSSRLYSLQPGAKLWVASSPAGFFTLDEVPQGRELWMLATGTALGPFLSILKAHEVWHRFEKIILVHAVRTAEELTYRETLTNIQRRAPKQFKTIAFVSREPTPQTLPGRIPAAIENGSLEARADTPLSVANSQVMICGNPNMVRDTTDVLRARGFTKNRRRDPGNITTENYW